MSVGHSSDAWKYARASGTEFIVLLALADNADDTTGHAWPSVATLARKCRVSERTVQRALQSLTEAGEIAPVNVSRGGRRSSTYRLTIAIPRHVDTPAEAKMAEPRQPDTPSGVTESPLAVSQSHSVTESPRQPDTARGVRLSPHPRQAVTAAVTQVSPEPSLNGYGTTAGPARKLAGSDDTAAATTPKPQRRRKPKRALPEGWAPTPRDIAWARSAGWPDDSARAQTQMFIANALSTDRRLADWSQGWRGWLLKAIEWNNGAIPTVRTLTTAAAKPTGSHEDWMVVR